MWLSRDSFRCVVLQRGDRDRPETDGWGGASGAGPVPQGACDVVLQPGIGAVEESATITTYKALVETYNVNTQFFLQWQALEHPFRRCVVDAQALAVEDRPARAG